MKNKSEVYNIFKKWKVMVENKKNMKVKCFRSNNGKEYIVQDFK